MYYSEMKRRKAGNLEESVRNFLEELEKRFEVEIKEDEPVFPVEVVCKLTHISYWTLRSILKEGIVHPKKKGKKKLLFSQEDVRRLECISYLMRKRGVNIKGVKMIFEISQNF